MRVHNVVHRPAVHSRNNPEPPTPPESAPSDGWVGAAVSVGGGLLAVAGGLKGDPLMVGLGAATVAVGTSMTAHRVKDLQGMDQAALVSFVAGGTLTAAGLWMLMNPPAPQGPSGPLPQFLERLGVRGL